MAIINWTDEALRWLKDIHGYIAQDNPSAAATVIEGIVEKTQMLATYPQMGQWYRTEPDGDIRILLYGHYRITYLIRADDRIDVLGVFHDAMDIEKYLPG